jgi:hypothetical protein
MVLYVLPRFYPDLDGLGLSLVLDLLIRELLIEIRLIESGWSALLWSTGLL